MKPLVLSLALFLLVFQVPFNPYSPATDGDVIMWNSASARFNWAPVSQSPDVILVPNRKRNALYIFSGGTAGTGYGNQTTTNLGSTAAQATDATNPVRLRFTSGGTLGNDAGSQSDLLTLRTGRNIRMQMYVLLVTTTSVREWLALTDQTLATMVASDNPAGNYAAFRYSTDFPDTNWQCITKDNTTQTVTNSLVPADTAGHKFEIREHTTAASYSFLIDGVQVCSHTTNLPTSGTNLKWGNGLETRTGSGRALDIAWVYTESDK